MVHQTCNTPDERRQVDAVNGVAADASVPQPADVKRDWTATTLGERVRYLAERNNVSVSALGVPAGLNRAAMSRLANDKSSEVKRFSGTIDRLAQAWNVAPEWLFYGRGQPEQAGEEKPADPFPHRARACEIALDGGIEPEAVREVAELSVEQVRALLAQHPGQPEDASILWWLRQIEMRGIALRSAARSQR
jgi:transcriptional regulator with XRE-family HTH domain